jgi:hypothetical protein
MKQITRFELINERGIRKEIIINNLNQTLYYDVQDNGKTLKVFSGVGLKK